MSMNKQEIFDKTVEHAVKQRAPCRNCTHDEWVWGYRGICNTKQGKVPGSCFVGCHIKDQYYNIELESTSVRENIVLEALSQSLGEQLSSEDVELFVHLQQAHDRCPVHEWPRKFKLIADIYGLKYNGPDTLDTLEENTGEYL